MLKIAAVANDYASCKSFVELKFRDKIEKINHMKQIYTLKNGDEIYLCYEDRNKDQYKSMEYDAFVVDLRYESLAEVIRFRSGR